MNADFSTVVRQKKNDELLTMVYQFDTWSPEMLQAVQNELTHRGILPADFIDRRQNLIEAEENDLSNGKDGSVLVLIVGWLTVLGLIGFFIGYNYAYAKTISRITGKKYFKYSADTRKDGRILMNTAIIAFIVILLYRILQS
jgi:hypothetical protein